MKATECFTFIVGLRCGKLHKHLDPVSLMCELMVDIDFIDGLDSIENIQFQIQARPNHVLENSCTPLPEGKPC